MADTDSGSEFEVGQILGERKTGKRGLEFLVRWKGFGKSEDSWEKSTALKDAKVAIQEFRQATTKKTKRKSSSRSRSRSRTRSKSRSPARSKKESSPARRSSRSRKSLTTTTTSVSQSPGKTEEKKETITQAPGLYEQKTETITKSVEPQRTATYSRTVETVMKTGPSKTIEPEQESLFQRWVSCCCAPVQKIGNCCRGLVTSDYPALVVFATISIIMLSFVLEKHVEVESLAGQERKVRRLPSLMYSMVFGRLITFVVGFAAGVYADQNFEVPKIKPDEYYEKIKEIIAQTKKDKDR